MPQPERERLEWVSSVPGLCMRPLGYARCSSCKAKHSTTTEDFMNLRLQKAWTQDSSRERLHVTSYAEK